MFSTNRFYWDIHCCKHAKKISLEELTLGRIISQTVPAARIPKFILGCRLPMSLYMLLCMNSLFWRSNTNSGALRRKYFPEKVQLVTVFWPCIQLFRFFWVFLFGWSFFEGWFISLLGFFFVVVIAFWFGFVFFFWGGE